MGARPLASFVAVAGFITASHLTTRAEEVAMDGIRSSNTFRPEKE